MARPKEFNEATVIAAARTTFWSNGFAATSITDLCESTQLSVGSIYKAFGSKAGLCRRTLDDYLNDGLARSLRLLSGSDRALHGLEAWLALMTERASSQTADRGCYAVVCATELAASDTDIRARLRAHDRKLHTQVADAIRLAVAEGDLNGDPEVGARLLCATVNGVQVEACKGISATEASGILRMALNALR
ncbi:MAG: TetR/AcrR family transcriptional regulator [Rhodoglobus sp.]